MDEIVIEGGRPLRGTVRISGAKNSALPILAASLLTEEASVIKNVPFRLRDVHTMVRMLRSLGAKARMDDDGIEVRPGNLTKCTVPYSLVSTMRASICVLGPLLAHLGRARVSLPGGCVIGPRPIDLHLKGIRALGAETKIEHGYIVTRSKQLQGNEIYLGGHYGSSVLATANVMMAATLAKGKTTIESAACEPELVDLADFLSKMGARIRGAGSPRVDIEGVKSLKGTTHTIIPDRIEAGTYMVAGAITRGDVNIDGARFEHLTAVIDKLQQAGVKIERFNNGIRVRSSGDLKPVDVTTLPYSGFPTDMQAQMMALMSVTEGISVITEKIFPDRFLHISELERMGSRIFLEGTSAIVHGVKRLSGAPVMASDLRASAALILAGLVADGQTRVSRVYHLDRGYERIEEKLSGLGAKIKRIKG